jgi:hypothetical protein
MTDEVQAAQSRGRARILKSYTFEALGLAVKQELGR